MEMVELATDRTVLARRGKRLEYFTIAWNCLERLIGMGAGLLAGSISPVGFGMDSFIEVTSAPRCSGACPTMPAQSAGREPSIWLCELSAYASSGLRST
jgi:hypothetical protein